MNHRITTRNVGDVAVLDISAALELSSVARVALFEVDPLDIESALPAAVRTAAATTPKILLNLGEVEKVDGHVAAAVIGSYAVGRAADAEVAICTPRDASASERLMNRLSVACMKNMIHAHDSVDAGVRSFAAASTLPRETRQPPCAVNLTA